MASQAELGGTLESQSHAQRTSKGEWHFVHVLAIHAILTVCLLFGVLVLFMTAGSPVEVPALLRGIAGIGVIAILWFWIRMLVDFFRERPARYPVLWGWALILGSYLGGIAYFFLVWRPRNQPRAT